MPETSSSAKNKRIAQNTFLLYIRMIFLMLISLYTSRVILNALGVKDYGVYNVVGGVVAMFSILSNSFSSSVSRFLTFELGKNDMKRLKQVFSTSLIVQISMAFFISVVAEIIGIWFLNYKMNLPHDRIDAANWVMHCSILSFVVSLLSTPFNATIISHEKMGTFAYVSILDGIFKLCIAFFVSVSAFDKLELYATLLLLESFLVGLIYGIYCKINFKEINFKFSFDKPLIKEMTSFAGWTMFGNGAYMFNTHGVNILINMFFGVTLNAARGIATQVEQAVTQFVNNFTTALNPQITKSYAEGDFSYMHSLVCHGAKYSYFLMLFFAVPIGLETERILSLWLKIVPDYAVAFVRLTFVTSMCTIIGNTLVASQFATGQIKKYQITVALWGALVFPLTWVAFLMGYSPLSAYWIYTFIYFVLIFIRIYLVKDLIMLPWQKYFKEVLIKCLMVSVGSFVFPYLLYKLQDPSILRLIEVIIAGIISVIMSIYTLGLEPKEKQFIINQIQKSICK